MRKITQLVLGALSAAFLLLAPLPAHASAAPSIGDDLRTYYPNSSLYTTEYLNGHNYLPDPTNPSWSVLWFQAQDQHTYFMYNSDPASPTATCHSDQLSWWPDGYLRYVRTVDQCGQHLTIMDFGSSPIIFLPQVWSGGAWSLSGSSPATYSVDGGVRCTGTTVWLAQVLGVEWVTATEQGLHWRTTQMTAWATGDVTGGCWAGYATRWQEDYWLVTDLPSPSGSPARGLRRTKGGNLDDGSGNWDVWMDSWATLP
jgi:hypothetical protein